MKEKSESKISDYDLLMFSVQYHFSDYVTLTYENDIYDMW